MKMRIAIVHVASVLLGAFLPLEVTLAAELEAYAGSDATQHMCQVREARNMSLAVTQAPCEQRVESQPCMALSGDVEKSEAPPAALAAKSDLLPTPASIAYTPPPVPDPGISLAAGGAVTLSHITTVVLRV